MIDEWWWLVMGSQGRPVYLLVYFGNSITDYSRHQWSVSQIHHTCRQLQRMDGDRVIFNTLRPRQNGHHLPDDIFKGIFLNENEWISIQISLKLVPKGLINNIPALVLIMAWRRPGDKPLSGPMMVSLLTHICVSRPQWVNRLCISSHK